MMEYESEDKFEDGLPSLEAKYDSNFDSNAMIVWTNHTYYRKDLQETRSTSKTTIARASVQVSLENKKGNKKAYLVLLDTGSTYSVMSEALVNTFKLETTKKQ